MYNLKRQRKTNKQKERTPKTTKKNRKRKTFKNYSYNWIRTE